MTKLLAAAALACALMTGCATTPDVRLATGKADAAAWHTLDGAAISLKALADAGQLKGAKAAEAKRELDQAAAALTAADAAYQAGNGATAQQNVATASDLIAKLLLLIAQAKGP